MIANTSLVLKDCDPYEAACAYLQISLCLQTALDIVSLRVHLTTIVLYFESLIVSSGKLTALRSFSRFLSTLNRRSHYYVQIHRLADVAYIEVHAVIISASIFYRY